MTRRILIALSITVAIPFIACAEPQVEQTQPSGQAEAPVAVVQTTAAVQTDPAELLRNGKMPFAGVLVGGQPTADQIRTLASLGYGTVVNLRTLEEKDQTDPALVESLGMKYVVLPIGDPATLNEQNAVKLAEILNDADAPVVVHCASGNRVGGLFALKAFYADGKTPEEALAIGRDAGITRIEPLIREKLGLE